MNEATRQLIEQKIAAYTQEAERVLAQYNALQGAKEALRDLLAAPAPPIEQKEPEING